MKQDNIALLAAQLAGSTQWLSASDLALLLHTTTRTIRNYVQALNHNAGEKSLILSGPKGYRWNSEYEHLREHYILVRTPPESPRERELYILRELLYRGSADLLELADALMVSDRTVQLDLEQIRRRVRRFDVSLRLRKDRISLGGKESSLRHLSCACITRTTGTELLTLELIRGAFPLMDVSAIDQTLLETLSAHGLGLNAYAHYELLLLLLIQIVRIEQGHRIESGELPVESLSQTPDATCAAALAKGLGAQLGIEYLPAEIDYLTAMLLCKAEYDGPYDFLADTEFSELPERVRFSFEIVRRRFGAALFQTGVPRRLIHFCHRMIVRSRMRLRTYNPMTDALRAAEPYLYSCAGWVMTEFIKHYGVHPAAGETAFLALAFAELLPDRLQLEPPIRYVLICPSYGAIGNHLTMKLEQKFQPRLQQIALLDSLDVEQLPQADLCLSVLPLKNRRRLIQISPLLSEIDCEAIRREVNRLDYLRHRDALTACLTRYSQPAFFHQVVSVPSREEAITQICNALEQAGIVDERFCQTVLLREQADSTAIAHLIALPHACLSTVRHNTIYIYRSETPIPWGEDNVNLVILMAFRRDLLDDFKYAYTSLIKVLSHPKHVAAILNAKNLDDAIEAISKFNLE